MHPQRWAKAQWGEDVGALRLKTPAPLNTKGSFPFMLSMGILLDFLLKSMWMCVRVGGHRRKLADSKTILCI